MSDLKEFRAIDIISVSESGEKTYHKTIVTPLMRQIKELKKQGLLPQSFQPKSLRYEQLEYLGDAVLHLEISKKQLAVAGLMSGPGILSQERSAFERRECLAIVFDDLELQKFMPDVPLEFFFADRWKRRCDCVEALLGEMFQTLETLSLLPPVAKNSETELELKTCVDLLVEAIIYRGKQLPSTDEVKALHKKAKEQKWRYV